MMLGSQRVMLNSAFGERAAASFTVRDVAPDVLLFGNIGLSQLTKDAVPDIVEALDRVGANALAVHTNPLQEAVQHNGDTDFAGSLDRLHDLAAMLGYPVLLKEVGHGIGATAVAELLRLTGEPPVAAIDVAGAGGTSWSRVEQLVRYGEVRYPDLADWGIPTAQAIPEVRAALPDIPLVASGGIRTGMDAAKALALGADVVAVARPLLGAAIESADAATAWLQRFIDELRICLHGCGTADLRALRNVGATLLPTARHMAVILAYGSPALGHLYPLGALLRELAGRGHQIHLRTLASEVATMRGDRHSRRGCRPADRGHRRPGLAGAQRFRRSQDDDSTCCAGAR